MAKIRLNQTSGFIKNNNSQLIIELRCTHPFDLKVIPKVSSTEIDHSLGATDEWQMGAGGLKKKEIDTVKLVDFSL